ncbi:MAG TPA: PepSY domain-containing protein [Accumulibacter sp.]|nr:PepSY domain-containing protein [Accumulibacter sp.]
MSERCLKRSFIRRSSAMLYNDPMIRLWRVLLCCLLPLGAVFAVRADDGDHERARHALEAGEVLPLAKILQAVEREHPGQVIEVELERHHWRWLYEIKLLRNDGALLKLKVDARDATILAIRGRDGDGRNRRFQP